MKLELSKEETEAVLLAWAEAKWPATFNAVEIDANYSSVRKVIFTKEEPPQSEAAPSAE